MPETLEHRIVRSRKVWIAKMDERQAFKSATVKEEKDANEDGSKSGSLSRSFMNAKTSPKSPGIAPKVSIFHDNT